MPTTYKGFTGHPTATHVLAQGLIPCTRFTLTWPSGVTPDAPNKVYLQQAGQWPQRYLADAMLCLACGGELVAYE